MGPLSSQLKGTFSFIWIAAAYSMRKPEASATRSIRQIRACRDPAGLCRASRVADWHHRGSASTPWRQRGRCCGCCGAGLLAGSGGAGLGWLGVRVARWVADRCRRALFCVAGRCSVLAFALVRPHSRWSGNPFGLHGMQEVRSSNLLSSTFPQVIGVL
jgi:hypothetical protein